MVSCSNLKNTCMYMYNTASIMHCKSILLEILKICIFLYNKLLDSKLHVYLLHGFSLAHTLLSSLFILLSFQKKTGNVFAVDCDPRRGLVCLNLQQDFGTKCADYKVRFLCPAGTIKDTRGVSCRDYCVSRWFDRDDPSGQCDCEQLKYETSVRINAHGINCVEVGTGKDHQDLGQRMTCNQKV